MSKKKNSIGSKSSFCIYIGPQYSFSKAHSGCFRVLTFWGHDSHLSPFMIIIVKFSRSSFVYLLWIEYIHEGKKYYALLYILCNKLRIWWSCYFVCYRFGPGQAVMLIIAIKQKLHLFVRSSFFLYFVVLIYV